MFVVCGLLYCVCRLLLLSSMCGLLSVFLCSVVRCLFAVCCLWCCSCVASCLGSVALFFVCCSLVCVCCLVLVVCYLLLLF